MSTERSFASRLAMFLVGQVGDLFNAYAITVLWRWFIVGFGLPELRWHIAGGIAVLVHLLTFPRTLAGTIDGKTFKSTWEWVISAGFVMPGMSLLCGWIWTLLGRL